MSPRFECKAKAVTSVHRVRTQVVDRLAQPFHRFVSAAARVGFGALAPAPKDKNLRAELRTKIHRPHRFLDGVCANARIVRGKRAVAEHRVVEQVDRRHRHHDAVTPTCGLKVFDNPIPLGRRGVYRNKIVIVEVDAPGPHFGQQRDRVCWRKHGTDRIAERIASAVSYRPETERKFVLRPRSELIRHKVSQDATCASTPPAMLRSAG
jgi:hypothetical protein